jgi:hypothetical protein
MARRQAARRLMPDYFLCGWRVRSAVALPELAAWSGDPRPPDVEIAVRRNAHGLRDAVAVSPILSIDRHGSACLSIDGVARYLVHDGREILIDTLIDDLLPDIRVFLFSTVLGLLCHQRGLLPLRAACVVVGGKAVALAGSSGRGKSTVAASLALRGHAPIADSICVVDPFAAEGPVVLPGFAYLSLWKRAANALALPDDGRLDMRRGNQKYRYPVGVGRLPRLPVPLSAVCVLDWADRARPPGIASLGGAEGAVTVRRMLLPGKTAGNRAWDARLFRGAAILSRDCTLARVTHAYGLPAVALTSALLETWAM